MWQNKDKIFCIGRNKTGTTSIEKWMQMIGCSVAPQQAGENCTLDVINGDYSKLNNLVLDFNGFQDLPYNLPNVPQHLHKNYPNAYFILTVRRSSDEWYQSLVRYNRKIEPTQPIGKTTVAEMQHKIYGDYIENKQNCIEHYEKYNMQIEEYMIRNNARFIKLCLSEPNANQILCDFVGVNGINLPHLNKSK